VDWEKKVDEPFAETNLIAVLHCFLRTLARI
jgi:hypothetical protein